MSINTGDLVQRRNPKDANTLGIVLDRRIANGVGSNSDHMKHILNACLQVCYVFFTGEGVEGPIYESDLVVKQSSVERTSIDA